MHRSLLEFLVDPLSRAPLEVLDAGRPEGDDIIEGTLGGSDGRTYAIRKGIPRLVVGADRDQQLTEETFAFKWGRRDTYDSPEMRSTVRQWQVQRYGFESPREMETYFEGRGRILDAGCGSGFSTSLWMAAGWRDGSRAEWVGVDISTAIDVARERLGCAPRTHFIQADLLHLPFRDASFDTIFSEGVLHHTPSTERALKTLVRVLEPGGEIMCYVYRKKGPVREFADDHIRARLSHLPPDSAWDLLRPLTSLGKALSELHAEVDVPEDIPYLGIRAGRYDVQRLVYWNFLKQFWNPALTFEENNHVNFDWYHPRYAHRHTEDEIRQWCDQAGLAITHFDTATESGFTVRAIKA